MEVSPAYGIINLIIVSVFYVCIAFAIAWILSKKTRIFGLTVLIAVLLVVQIHANTLYFLTFSNLPQGYNFAGLATAFVFIIGLLAFQYQQLRASRVALYDAQFKQNLGKGLLVVIGVTIGLSVLGIVF